MRTFVFLLPLVVCLTAQAQTPGSCDISARDPQVSVSGTVTDPSGAVLSDALVRVACDTLRLEVHANANGEYSIVLPQGTFTLEARSPRFSPLAREVRVSGTTAARVDFVLNLEGERSTITVTANTTYVTEEESAGAKMTLPLLELPQSVTVVTRKLLDDQGAVKLDDALKNVAGVMPGGYYDGWDYYRIRGFDGSFNTFLDGLRGGNGTSDETLGLESIEVLKGPSSALYGQSVLGGLVNLRSKRPRQDAFLNLEYTGGSFGFNSPMVDFGGSINRSRTLYGRVVALYRFQDSFTDYAYLHRGYVAPSLTWRIARATSVTFLTRFQDDKGRHAYPLPAKGTIAPNINGDIPISRYVGEVDPDGNSVKERNRQFGWEFTHSFQENLSFRQTARFVNYKQTWRNLLYPGYLSADETTLYRYPLDYDQDWNNYAIDSSLSGRLQTGGIRHNLLGGYDFFRHPNTYSGKTIDFGDPASYMPLNLFNPVYGQTPYSPIFPAYGGKSIVQFQGLYVQDHINLGDRLTITAGGRFNFASNQDVPDQSASSNAFTPRVGANYHLRSGVALYGSYSGSFMPQSGRVYDENSANGKFAPPEKGSQWEGGIKSSLMNGRLTATAAYFYLKRNNVLTNDVTHPNFSVVTGQQRSRGFEAESTFWLRNGLSLSAAYSFIDAIVSEDNSIPVGTRLWNAPRNAMNVWLRYEVQNGWAQGLGFGLGGRYYTDQPGDLYDTFRIPAYGVMDAAISYRYRKFRVQVNGFNLTDTLYATGSYNDIYVKPGAPRSGRITVGYTF